MWWWYTTRSTIFRWDNISMERCIARTKHCKKSPKISPIYCSNVSIKSAIYRRRYFGRKKRNIRRWSFATLLRSAVNNDDNTLIVVLILKKSGIQRSAPQKYISGYNFCGSNKNFWLNGHFLVVKKRMKQRCEVTDIIFESLKAIFHHQRQQVRKMLSSLERRKKITSSFFFLII